MAETTLYGFEGLWGVVTRAARARLFRDFPEAVQEFFTQGPAIEEANELAQKLGLKESYTKALAAGLACRQSISRLRETKLITEGLDRNAPIAPNVEMITFDVVRVYDYAYIDATKNFCMTALGQLVPEDDDTRARRDAVSAWASDAKQKLSKARQSVAHGAAGFLSGLSEDGHWPYLLLLDVLSEEALREMWTQSVVANHERFDWRMSTVLAVAVRVIAEGEAEMGATATLIASKLKPPDASSG